MIREIVTQGEMIRIYITYESSDGLAIVMVVVFKLVKGQQPITQMPVYKLKVFKSTFVKCIHCRSIHGRTYVHGHHVCHV